MPASQQPKTEVLRQQRIDLGGPGTILRDFESLLEFIGTEGLRATGKYHLLPLDRLLDLDARMSKPLRLRLEPPQQRSFPHLNGLYLLLRATRLGVPKGVGKTSGRLLLDPAVLDSWRALNDTERYFNLLEAWLLHACEEMVGESGRGFGDAMLWRAAEMWRSVGEKGVNSRRVAARERLPLYGPIAYCTLALLELFGLVDVERGEPTQGENWRIVSVRRTGFGEALFDTIFTDELDSSAEDEEQPDFGVWQPVLKEYFPDWRNNLELPEPEFRDGIYYFKVELGGPWRRIAIPADHTLEDLAAWIIKAFKFDGDHLYNFTFPERDGSHVSVEHPEVDDAWMHTDEYSIGCLPMEKGQSIEFMYDFGASWQCDVRLEKVEPPDRRITKPRIVESHGTAPKEYDFDE